ncbi:MAG: glycosyltransferase, partial [Spirochaetes bacterium]|nr:glycosyltransferase [Spirochaetota bacterium]
MRLLWADDQRTFAGAKYGFSIHSLKMRQALTAAGVTIYSNPSEVDASVIAVHIQTPDHFRPIPGRRNLLFTMNEMTPAHKQIRAEAAKLADIIVTPCAFCAREYAQFCSAPIHICPEGVDPALFPHHARAEPGPDKPFRFLFVGADFFTAYKGGMFLLSAWKKWLKSGRMPSNVQLYIKTSDIPGSEIRLYTAKDGDLLESWWSAEFPPALAKAWEGMAPKKPSMIIDVRNLPLSELVALYNSAHAFVLPTPGEGWALTLTDAMATGAPCSWSHNTAMLDYADGTIG